MLLPLTFDVSSAKLRSNFLSVRFYWEESFMLLSDTLKMMEIIGSTGFSRYYQLFPEEIVT
jgi:hypothetical protein